MSNTIEAAFGNSIIAVILEADGTFPTSLTLYAGSTGNILKFDCLAKDSTKSGIEASTTEYMTNDDQIYATKDERKYMTTANLFKRNETYSQFFEDLLVDAKAAGKKVLEITNLGYTGAKWKESFAIGEIAAKSNEEDNKPEASMPYEFRSTPPSGAFSLTTTNITAVNTAVGSGSVKCTVAVTIAASITGKPRTLKYT